MSIVRCALVMLLAACLGTTACGSPGAAGKQSPAPPSAVPAADAAARCQELADRHVTPCPPASLPLERITIRNATHGAVSDDDARMQGQAYLRAHALYVWAVRQDAGDAFLMSGALVPAETARTNIFRAEIKLFADARAAGGRARIDPLTTTEVTLVAVPQALQDLARREGLVPSAYAWVDNQEGPARAWIETPAGSRDEVRIGAGQPHPILVFGQVRNDAGLGSIWYAGGEFGCLASAQVRAVCGV
ncbi:MAG TPA: hypothetical protein VLW53_04910 [Candidatus Eisenbacteria bacterium]|nr:hypothetical protein [Candidatus Eisenbacteria bacterium]